MQAHACEQKWFGICHKEIGTVVSITSRFYLLSLMCVHVDLLVLLACNVCCFPKRGLLAGGRKRDTNSS